MPAYARRWPSILWVWLKGLATLLAVLTAAVIGFLIVSIIGLGPGGSEVVVPDVLGAPLNRARRELRETDLTSKVVAEKYHSSVPEGRIIRMRPRERTRVRAGRQIELTVSKGPREIRVPNVVGKSLAEATRQLEERYLTVGEKSHRRSDRPIGEIIAQAPVPGQHAARGELVDLVLSGGPDYGMLVDSAGRKVLFRRIKVVVPAGEPFQQVQISLHDQQGSETIYDRIHEPGDEIVVGGIQAASGTVVRVHLDHKQVFEQRW